MGMSHLYDADGPEMAARWMLRSALSELPLAGAIAPPPAISADDDEAVHLSLVHMWVDEFGRHLQTVIETTAAMARELSEQRAQRDAVRAFLGTDKLGESE